MRHVQPRHTLAARSSLTNPPTRHASKKSPSSARNSQQRESIVQRQTDVEFSELALTLTNILSMRGKSFAKMNSGLSKSARTSLGGALTVPTPMMVWILSPGLQRRCREGWGKQVDRASGGAMG